MLSDFTLFERSNRQNKNNTHPVGEFLNLFVRVFQEPADLLHVFPDCIIVPCFSWRGRQCYHWLTYRQTAWNDVRCPSKMRKLTLRHNVQRHLDQSESEESFEYHLLRALASNEHSLHFVGMKRHLKFCRYVSLASVHQFHTLEHTNMTFSCPSFYLLWYVDKQEKQNI